MRDFENIHLKHNSRKALKMGFLKMVQRKAMRGRILKNNVENMFHNGDATKN